ncbi:HAD family hydrolase [Streptomyces sp. NPDC047002]|uniref:HAD family hydrolase n=1 Tax=Streptomyces sp. NPDC047002 TaxID=3155475 RepID=UPI003451C8C4
MTSTGSLTDAPSPAPSRAGSPAPFRAPGGVLAGDGPRTAAALLADASLVMWDFDGPLCHLFAGLSAPLVAAELRGFARGRGLDTRALREVDDPLELCASVHRRFAGSAPGTVDAVRGALDRLEERAARRAAPTPGARELLGRLRELGKRQVVVSNNSAGAVAGYLRDHGLEPYVAQVVGRPCDPDLMKPHPHSLEKALTTAGADAADALMIGDSAADALAAAKVGAAFLGYATRPARAAALRAAGAEHLTDDLGAQAAALGG